VDHLNESSVKDDELNRILDKISDKKDLTDLEKKFLSNLNSYSDDLLTDYMYLTKNDVFNKVRDLLEGKRIVICDLCDKNGKIGIKIKSIHNTFDDDFCFVLLQNKMKIILKDNYSYNIIYNIKRDEYSLETQDEFFERIPIMK
jgi:hypothetical protein